MTRLMKENQNTTDTMGVLELLANDTEWTPVCADGFDISDARVACSEMCEY